MYLDRYKVVFFFLPVAGFIREHDVFQLLHIFMSCFYCALTTNSQLQDKYRSFFSVLASGLSGSLYPLLSVLRCVNQFVGISNIPISFIVLSLPFERSFQVTLS